MKIFLKCVFIFLFPLFTFGSEYTYYYNSRMDKCIDSQGLVGYNIPDLSQIFVLDHAHGSMPDSPTISNRNLECMDLRNVNFGKILNSGATYVSLKNWNLKGARFSGTNITWMVFSLGSIEGVDLTSSIIGYTMFRTVRVDANTKGIRDGCAIATNPQIIDCQM